MLEKRTGLVAGHRPDITLHRPHVMQHKLDDFTRQHGFLDK